MNIERLRKILEHSEKYRDDILVKVQDFHSFAGVERQRDVRNILPIVRPALRRKGYLVFEIPIHDEEIGALCYKADGLGSKAGI